MFNDHSIVRGRHYFVQCGQPRAYRRNQRSFFKKCICYFETYFGLWIEFLSIKYYKQFLPVLIWQWTYWTINQATKYPPNCSNSLSRELTACLTNKQTNKQSTNVCTHFQKNVSVNIKSVLVNVKTLENRMREWAICCDFPNWVFGLFFD